MQPNIIINDIKTVFTFLLFILSIPMADISATAGKSGIIYLISLFNMREKRRYVTPIHIAKNIMFFDFNFIRYNKAIINKTKKKKD